MTKITQTTNNESVQLNQDQSSEAVLQPSFLSSEVSATNVATGLLLIALATAVFVASLGVVEQLASFYTF